LSRNAIAARLTKKAPPSTPPTIPPIAPTDRPFPSMETEALGAVEEVVDVIADNEVAPAGVVEKRGVTWPVATAKACQY
jgi:hypothetical protein